MDYNKIYNKLIERAKNRKLNVYHENHHIIPKCLGGDNDITNKVKLLPEEHYIAHQLLVKIYPNNKKLIYAAHILANTVKGNKEYGWLKRKFISNNSGNNHYRFGKQLTDKIKQKISISLSGPKHPNYGKKLSTKTIEKIRIHNTGKKRSDETKKKISESKTGKKHPNYGKRTSQETKIKQSLVKRGILFTTEHKQKLSIAAKNKPKTTNETRYKLSIAGKKAWETRRKNKEK